ncbi:unnamed protein product [Psylliodes chrysocephalus]|uniref:Amino acid transporter n=1 Tax=Psylliodes chrysocephalus TaxID=3402493 RepID=A0A9P0D749_9CUCU|nr:unnamed protein product [Psylliodes chrysocephala]
MTDNNTDDVEKTTDQHANKFGFEKWVGKNLLLILTLMGVLFGIILGFSLRPLRLQETTILLISYPGELYMRILKLVILPLIMSSLITGCSSVNARLNGKIALRTFSYFLVTSMFNGLLGVILGVTFQPGDPGLGLSTSHNRQERVSGSVLDSMLDMGRNIAADNIFQATFQQVYTDYVNTTKILNEINGTSHAVSKIEKVLKYRLGTNNLGIVFFCIAFGTILGTMGTKGKLIKDFFAVIFEIIMKMVKGILWITPLGLCSIIAGKIMIVADIAVVMSQLGWLILTVILGVLFYQFVVLQLVYFLVVRKNPFKYYLGVIQGTLTAFAAASTAAALPVNMDIMDNELKIDPRITRFVMPIGCNTNLDGTAMFLAISIIFITQMSGFSLGMGNLLTIWFTATIMSFAVTSVPSSALIILVMVLSAMGIPTTNVPLLFAVDWLVDRFRTTNNMLGDCYAAAIVEALSKKELLENDYVNVEVGENCKNGDQLKNVNSKFEIDEV